jgi:hypothetical protein
MNRKTVLAGGAVLSLVFSFVGASSVHALSGSDLNYTRRSTQRNFRRPVGLAEKYRRNKRSLERRIQDQFTAPIDGQSTFHRREDYLRDAYKKRFEADLKSREHSNVRRADVRDDREQRSRDSTLRRIRRAERGGVRLRAISSQDNYNKKTDQEKRERAAAYRKRIIDTQIKRYSEMDNVDCSILSGRRQSHCYYRQQKED